MSHSSLAIKTQVFEGPLELLIELVEKRKLLINDISLATVTDEYMEKVSLMQEESLPNTAHFVQLAATLLLIKSKSLLPVLELSHEEEESIEALEERLKRYQFYRDLAKDIELQFGRRVAHERKFFPTRVREFTPDNFTTLAALHSAMRELIAALPVSTQTVRAKVKPAISLEEMVLRLEERIAKASKITLRELTGDTAEQKEVIVGFLAILESVKQGQVLVAQFSRFTDIEVTKDRLVTPKYY